MSCDHDAFDAAMAELFPPIRCAHCHGPITDGTCRMCETYQKTLELRRLLDEVGTVARRLVYLGSPASAHAKAIAICSDEMATSWCKRTGLYRGGE